MLQSLAQLEAAGLEVTDLGDGSAYAQRRVHLRNTSSHWEGLLRLATALVQRPETILQELVEAAVRLCGADSAGISVEREDKTDEHFYHWVAIAGAYTPFLDAILPRTPSACSVCLERGTPQLFRVDQRFFNVLGVEAPLVKDGILLPWKTEQTQGTIFIISHTRDEAFDVEDLRLMQVLANFAAMGIRQQRQQELLRQQAADSAAMSMANHLAHQINNPLQSLANLLFLAKQSSGIGDEKSLALKMEDDFERLTLLTKELLEVPIRRSKRVLSAQQPFAVDPDQPS
jgi:hypothetical protein